MTKGNNFVMMSNKEADFEQLKLWNKIQEAEYKKKQIRNLKVIAIGLGWLAAGIGHSITKNR